MPAIEEAGWVVRDDLVEYPPPGEHNLNLRSLRRVNFGFGLRYRWEWEYADRLDTATFGTLTTQSTKRSNALGLLTALNGGQRPTFPLDPRSFVGRSIRATTFRKANSYPAIFDVRPINPESNYVYQIQTKKAMNEDTTTQQGGHK